MATHQEKFEQTLYNRFIPEFCSELKRNCQPSGFKKPTVQISEHDARYFMMALHSGLIEHQGCGRYRAARSSTFEQLFSQGLKAREPRQFTLWLEPLITIGGLARLHFDYGWPKDLIGTQSVDYAFDLVTFLSDGPNEFIACEVKNTPGEIEQLLRLMKNYGQNPAGPVPPSGKERNAFKKVVALRSRRPPVFWALGPDGLSRVFKMKYSAGDVLEFLPVSDSALVFPSSKRKSIAKVTHAVGLDGLKDCFREPIPEIFEAAKLLNAAVSEHLLGNSVAAEEALRAADMPEIGEWIDSIWLGPRVPPYRPLKKVTGLPPVLPKADRFIPRDAPSAMKRALVARDGHHCRLCGIPLVRAEIRKKLTHLYPDAARWTGVRAIQQHRGLQVMWLQYDHVIVHSRGGETTMDNIVVTCPACNFGRDRFMLEEVRLRDPRLHIRRPSWDGWRTWEGLERILPPGQQFLSRDSDRGGNATTELDGVSMTDYVSNGSEELGVD